MGGPPEEASGHSCKSVSLEPWPQQGALPQGRDSQFYTESGRQAWRVPQAWPVPASPPPAANRWQESFGKRSPEGWRWSPCSGAASKCPEVSGAPTHREGRARERKEDGGGAGVAQPGVSRGSLGKEGDLGLKPCISPTGGQPRLVRNPRGGLGLEGPGLRVQVSPSA